MIGTVYIYIALAGRVRTPPDGIYTACRRSTKTPDGIYIPPAGGVRTLPDEIYIPPAGKVQTPPDEIYLPPAGGVRTSLDEIYIPPAGKVQTPPDEIYIRIDLLLHAGVIHQLCDYKMHSYQRRSTGLDQAVLCFEHGISRTQDRLLERLWWHSESQINLLSRDGVY